jgi:CheY-like chemotaxis protein
LVRAAGANDSRERSSFAERIDAGALEIRRSAISVRELMRELVLAQREHVASRSLELRLAVLDTVPPVWGDKDRLLQVFDNLIGNATKFTRTGSITVGAEPRDREVVFWVADTGVGIAPPELPHLFDRFWQGARQRGARTGVGLGLAIVKGLVEAHGGRVWVESRVGEGSTFFITVPKASESGSAVARPPAPSRTAVHDTGRRLVLVADDDAEFRETLEQLFRNHGLGVVVARDGAEAIEVLNRKARPDLVLLDLSMPVADGWSVLRVRNSDPSLRAVPVIVASAQWGVRDRVAAERAYFLKKPIDPEQLLSMVGTLIAEASTTST